jgi:hypothetical protein
VTSEGFMHGPKIGDLAERTGTSATTIRTTNRSGCCREPHASPVGSAVQPPRCGAADVRPSLSRFRLFDRTDAHARLAHAGPNSSCMASRDIAATSRGCSSEDARAEGARAQSHFIREVLHTSCAHDSSARRPQPDQLCLGPDARRHGLCWASLRGVRRHLQRRLTCLVVDRRGSAARRTDVLGASVATLAL